MLIPGAFAGGGGGALPIEIDADPDFVLSVMLTAFTVTVLGFGTVAGAV